ncbi:MAG: hypothetical protein M5U22_23155 [Thermoleophilia bacterium]|nr:hypothetical protein [Thermoleophilia bacterium]
METLKTMTREQLYEAVWTTPVVQLAKRYGLSDVGLAKICTQHQVPRPGLGYWAKKQHGKEEPRPDLPVLDNPKLQVVVLTERPASEAPDEPERYAEDDEVNSLIIAEREAPAVEVPASLRSPHPLVTAAMEDDAIRASEERQRKPGMGWSSVVFQPRGSIARANISASKALKPRAYRVMNAVLRAAEERGYAVSGKPDQHERTTLIEVLGQKFDIRIYEPSVQRPHVLIKEERERKAKYPSTFIDKHDYVSSGQLCLQLRPEGGWTVYWQVRDGKKVRVEDRLNKLFIAALKQVDQALKWKRKREQEAAAAREAERRRLAEEERRKLAEETRKQEQAKVQSLLNEVTNWRRSRDLRAYLRQVRRVIAEQGRTIEPGSDLDKRLRWAERVADDLDPLRPPESLPTEGESEPMPRPGG